MVLEQNLFPLHDGLRKQVWFHALSLRKQHPKSDIQIINIAQGNRVQDEISIIGRRWWNMFFFRTDILHYFGSPSPIVAGLLLFSGYKKAFLSITDGAVSEFWKSVFSRQSVFLIRRKVSRIFYFTEYQRNILATYFDTSILCRVLPYIEHFTPIKEKSPHPRLLFMSHLSKHKGIDVVLEAYVRVLSRYPNLELVVADS
ncbi:MAG: hypothetical protein H6767_09775 [Candidatus Peribacteria bacterium]|nr:MAG: hypothetical protein H6767_09775 [Candidatus Peribacteria bacterium]